MSRRVATLATALALAMTAAVASGSAAAADGIDTPLPGVRGIGDLAVAGDRVFVAARDQLAVAEMGLSPASVQIYDVNGADATLRGIISGHNPRTEMSNLSDIRPTSEGRLNWGGDEGT